MTTATITGNLRFWMAGPRLTALRNAAEAWWREQATAWLRLPAIRHDMLTAPMRIVDLMAWQRGIERFRGEPERLYRLRVHHAFANALDAGTPAGMYRIFERLELPIFALVERVPGYDWDMIGITLSSDDFAAYGNILDALFSQYQRTCRRWLYTVRIASDGGTTNIPAVIDDKEIIGGMIDAFVDDNVIAASATTSPERMGGMVTATMDDNQILIQGADGRSTIAAMTTATAGF